MLRSERAYPNRHPRKGMTRKKVHCPDRCMPRPILAFSNRTSLAREPDLSTGSQSAVSGENRDQCQGTEACPSRSFVNPPEGDEASSPYSGKAARHFEK